VKDTKFNRSIFQLQVSALPTAEKEFSFSQSEKMWLTPSATMREKRSPEAMEKRISYRKSIGRTTIPPGSLAEQVQYGAPTTDMRIWPTPRASAAMSEDLDNIKERGVDKGRLEERVAKMMPTPTARDYKDSGPNTNYETARKKSRLAGTVGGSLNPTWVEWLMGYPAEYTDLKDWAILSSRKSRKKSVKQS
jgi:hypothetical protein